MLIARVGARFMAGSETVVEVAPVFRRGVGGIDVECLDGVDRLQHALDLGPAIDSQQDLAARAHERQRLETCARLDRAHDVHARDDGAEVVRRPAHERENAAWLEARDAAAAIEDLLLGTPAEA